MSDMTNPIVTITMENGAVENGLYSNFVHNLGGNFTVSAEINTTAGGAMQILFAKGTKSIGHFEVYLEENGELSDIQRIFVEETAIQCGYCTTGMIMSAKALLMHNSNPSEAEIRTALSGNICRCSGYTQIIRAVRRTAEEGGVR